MVHLINHSLKQCFGLFSAKWKICECWLVCQWHCGTVARIHLVPHLKFSQPSDHLRWLSAGRPTNHLTTNHLTTNHPHHQPSHHQPSLHLTSLHDNSTTDDRNHTSVRQEFFSSIFLRIFMRFRFEEIVSSVSLFISPLVLYVHQLG